MRGGGGGGGPPKKSGGEKLFFFLNIVTEEELLVEVPALKAGPIECRLQFGGVTCPIPQHHACCEPDHDINSLPESPLPFSGWCYT